MSASGMLYTWGYMGARPSDLMGLIHEFNIDTAIDVRSVPRSRVHGFNRNQLETFLGDAYGWAGMHLGGKGDGPVEAGLAWLAEQVAAGKRILIFCKECEPGDCHRHHAIALPLVRGGRLEAEQVRHIYQRELIEPADLQRAIDNDTDYDCEVW